ncbi:MAG: response regulator [Pseudomonadota bacterium]
MSRFDFGRIFHRQTAPAGEETKEGVGDAAKRIAPAAGTTILIVDDSKTIHLVLTRQLTGLGYDCLSAYDGESAIEMARQHKPALILMDVVMPILNGFQATREIRKDSDPKVAQVPVIMMSGNAQPTEELWSLKIKANAFLAKPFEDEELLTLLESLLYPDTAQA